MGIDEEKAFKGFILVVVVVLVIFGICAFTGCNPNYSEGARSGVIYKLSYKGVIYKSHEGEMNLGGMAQTGKDGSLAPNIWYFTVTDPAIVKEIEEVQRTGDRVTLHYKEWLMGPVQYGTGYVVWKVEHEKKEETPK